MQSELPEFIYDIQLKPGEPLALPKEASEIVGPGNWQVTIRRSDSSASPKSVRMHDAFMNSFAPEDDGLYDDYPTG